MFKYLKTLKNVPCDTTAPAFLSRFFPEHHVLVYRCIAFKAVASMGKQREGSIDRPKFLAKVKRLHLLIAQEAAPQC